jgi:hypothetical protein
MRLCRSLPAAHSELNLGVSGQLIPQPLGSSMPSRVVAWKCRLRSTVYMRSNTPRRKRGTSWDAPGRLNYPIRMLIWVPLLACPAVLRSYQHISDSHGWTIQPWHATPLTVVRGWHRQLVCRCCESNKRAQVAVASGQPGQGLDPSCA